MLVFESVVSSYNVVSCSKITNNDNVESSCCTLNNKMITQYTVLTSGVRYTDAIRQSTKRIYRYQTQQHNVCAPPSTMVVVCWWIDDWCSTVFSSVEYTKKYGTVGE